MGIGGFNDLFSNTLFKFLYTRLLSRSSYWTFHAIDLLTVDKHLYDSSKFHRSIEEDENQRVDNDDNFYDSCLRVSYIKTKLASINPHRTDTSNLSTHAVDAASLVPQSGQNLSSGFTSTPQFGQ